jgi:predicted HicB family RNase H-like nuclease
MTNYDMDEIEREKDRNAFAAVKKKEKTTEVEIELSADDLLILTLAAHEKDITLNQLVNNVLKDSLKDKSYKLELPTKPQVLKEY